MFCKFCGETIDRRTMRCSSCGKSVGSLAGGVGFWDLAGQPAQAAPATPAAPVVNPGEMEQLQGRNPINHKNGKRPAPQKLPILSVLALLLALVLLVMIIMIRVDIRALNRNYEALEQKYEELELKYEEVSSERGWLEQLLHDAMGKNDEKTEPQDKTEVSEEPADTTVPQNETYPDWIVKHPKDEPVTDGKKNSGEPIILFTLEVSRKNLEFHWEKYDEEADTWSEVDEEYYEVKEKDNRDGVSITLMLKEWIDDACGTYRCRIVEKNDNEKNIVFFSKEAKVLTIE